MEMITKVLGGPGASILTFLVMLVVLWKVVPYLALVGIALVRFFVNLCIAILGIGFIIFVGYLMAHVIFYPLLH